MRINYTGELGFGVTPKDLILATIGQMGVDGGVGPCHPPEFREEDVVRLAHTN